jgi:hypothetical protein
MTETVNVLHGIPQPLNRWEDGAAAGLSTLEGLAYRCNLLGADRALANQGGGNTSAKEAIVDHTGRETRVLWVKGSGTERGLMDLTGSTTTPSFAAGFYPKVAGSRPARPTGEAAGMAASRRVTGAAARRSSTRSCSGGAVKTVTFSPRGLTGVYPSR